jgi:hypothetical protein
MLDAANNTIAHATARKPIELVFNLKPPNFPCCFAWTTAIPRMSPVVFIAAFPKKESPAPLTLMNARGRTTEETSSSAFTARGSIGTPPGTRVYLFKDR